VPAKWVACSSDGVVGFVAVVVGFVAVVGCVCVAFDVVRFGLNAGRRLGSLVMAMERLR
jgi:hypothetical protein